jgi:hypothetical protein
LTALLFGLVTYLTLHPLWYISARQARELSARSDTLSVNLRMARALVQDEAIILDKYNMLKAEIAAGLYARNDLQDIVREAVQKNAVRVFELNWALDWIKDFVGIGETEVFINIRIEERNLQSLMTALLEPAYSYIDTLNFKDNVLTVRLRYLVPYGYPGKRRTN